MACSGSSWRRLIAPEPRGADEAPVTLPLGIINPFHPAKLAFDMLIGGEQRVRGIAKCEPSELLFRCE